MGVAVLFRTHGHWVGRDNFVTVKHAQHVRVFTFHLHARLGRHRWLAVRSWLLLRFIRGCRSPSPARSRLPGFRSFTALSSNGSTFGTRTWVAWFQGAGRFFPGFSSPRNFSSQWNFSAISSPASRYRSAFSLGFFANGAFGTGPAVLQVGLRHGVYWIKHWGPRSPYRFHLDLERVSTLDGGAPLARRVIDGKARAPMSVKSL